jgi:hypothetical protein
VNVVVVSADGDGGDHGGNGGGDDKNILHLISPFKKDQSLAP